MLFDIHTDTIDEVLRIRNLAKAALLQGQTVVSWSSEGSSATMVRELDIATVLRETRLFLQTVDPDTYGAKVKVARANFT